VGSSVDTVQFICDQAGLGTRLTFRKMFGEYALYLDGKVVALVCDDQLFLKPTPEGKAYLGPTPEGAPYPGCRPFLLISAALDDPERLGSALEITARALPAPKAKAKAKAKAKKTPAKPSAKSKTERAVTLTLQRKGSMCTIPVPFDSKAEFGKVRAPVKVTLHGYSFRSTIFSMGGRVFIPLRSSHREAARLKGTETLKVSIELDTDKRSVTVPPDLRKALATSKTVQERFAKLSYTHQREYVEAVQDAKKPETRARRIAAVLKAMRDRQ
jgi:TfoX/Sxy family transcriptional regulator of competence genes